jgi:hypothetical protein
MECNHWKISKTVSVDEDNQQQCFSACLHLGSQTPAYSQSARKSAGMDS